MILGQACVMILFQVYVKGFLEKHAIRQDYVLESCCAILIIFDPIVFFPRYESRGVRTTRGEILISRLGTFVQLGRYV